LFEGGRRTFLKEKLPKKKNLSGKEKADRAVGKKIQKALHFPFKGQR